MQSATGCSGGFRQRPIMSAALVSKSGVVAGHVLFKPVRLQPSVLPDPMHGFNAHAQSSRGLAAASVRRAIPGLIASLRQSPHPRPSSEQLRLLSEISCVQSGQSCARERCFQRLTIGAVVPNRCLISLYRHLRPASESSWRGEYGRPARTGAARYGKAQASFRCKVRPSR